MQRRTTDSTSRVISASWLADLQLFRNSAGGMNDSSDTDEPGFKTRLTLDSTGPKWKQVSSSGLRSRATQLRQEFKY